MQLVGLLMYETGRFLFWSWDKEDYVKRLWVGSMRINVVLTKVFQAVAVRYLGRDLQANIDHVPYTMTEIDVPCVEGVEVGEVIGSGMVAVVFEGMSVHGPVVIKVKRRDIASRIENGLRDAERLLRVLNWLPGMNVLGLETIHGEVQELLFAQLDFNQEMLNQLEFREIMADNSNVVVPLLYEELSCDEWIVMEKLEGTREPTHKEAVAAAIAGAVATSIINGVLHADMHVGNVIFMGEKIGIIDFGLMLRLSPTELVVYTTIFAAAVLKQFRGAADKAVRFYLVPSDVIDKLTESEQTKLVDDIASLYERSVQVRKSFGVSEVLAMADMVRPLGLRIAPIFYKTMMSMAAGDLLLKELSADPLELILAEMATKMFVAS